MATQRKNNSDMPNAHLHELFVDELRDILGAEKQLLKGLKKMASKASSQSLKSAFEQHYAQTEGHIDRVKKAFDSIDMTARGKTCKAMEGLLKEAEEIMEEFEGGEVMDAALISAAQKVEHYEIATYGSLRTFAHVMGHSDVERLLQNTLDNEKATDVTLTEIAEGFVNEQAASE